MEHSNSGVELTAFGQLPTDVKQAPHVVKQLPTDAKQSPTDVKSVDVQKLEISDAEQKLLKPGSKIRPHVTEEEAIRLAERLYGISTRDISELMSYDDKNFLIHIDTNIKNPIIPNAWSHGYVLKIINSLDSKKEKYIDGQTQMTLFLRQQGIECPKPVMNIFGKYFSVEKIGDSTHLVRLLEFVPGRIFNDVLKTKHLFYEVGEFIAKIDSALKRFTHDALENNKSVWQLESLPQLTKFLYAVNDVQRQALVQNVLVEFKSSVLDHYNDFARGVIHGDCNEHNIVVAKDSPTSDQFRVSGIIDFGDSCKTLYIFELAITITYMLLQSCAADQSCELETAGYVIAGYQEIRHIPEHERKILKICVASRLCQSLVLGCYSHTLDPENDYILSSQANGWKILSLILDTSNEEIEELWFSVADNYLKQSEKQ